MLPDHATSVERLLHRREARGLRVPVLARIVFALIGLVAVHLDPWGEMQLVPTLVTLMVTIVVVSNAYFLVLLRREKRLAVVGYGGVAIDVVSLVFYAWAQYELVLGASVSPAVLATHPLLAICICYAVINSLAARPLYPLVVTSAGLAVHAFILSASLGDPRTIWSSNPIEVFSGPASDSTLIVVQMVMLLFVGSLLALFAHGARSTVSRAVELEAERSRLEREHVRTVMQTKLQSFARLVAALSHEVNSPLGVLQSSSQSARRAVDKLRGYLAEVETEILGSRLERTLTVLEQTSDTSRKATQRMALTFERLVPTSTPTRRCGLRP